MFVLLIVVMTRLLLFVLEEPVEALNHEVLFFEMPSFRFPFELE